MGERSDEREEATEARRRPRDRPINDSYSSLITLVRFWRSEARYDLSWRRKERDRGQFRSSQV